MKFLSDPALLEEILRKWEIPGRFDTKGLEFRLARFQKGELLIAPFKPMDEFLFLAAGKVNIYGLREDGSMFSVCLVAQGVLLGDIEFVQRAALPFYAEAMEDTLCVELSMEKHRERLKQDVRFLNYLLQSVADKFHQFISMGDAAQLVEEKLLTFLGELQPDHTLHSINAGVIQLHCSRSQLQRVVRKLCQEGALSKISKGKYRLVLK